MMSGARRSSAAMSPRTRGKLLQVWRVALEQPRAGLGVGEDRGERLVELVRERPRQRAELRGARQVRQLQALDGELVGDAPAPPLLNASAAIVALCARMMASREQDLQPVALPGGRLVEEARCRAGAAPRRSRSGACAASRPPASAPCRPAPARPHRRRPRSPSQPSPRRSRRRSRRCRQARPRR